MIDHVSLGVRDLEASATFYEHVLAALSYTRLVTRTNTVGFGKKYPELWLNHRAQRTPERDSGMHVCLRAANREAIEAFYTRALQHGGQDEGAPGFRPEYHATYYAAFIRDLDGHVVEAVTFIGVRATQDVALRACLL